jgi:hypothetical protein
MRFTICPKCRGKLLRGSRRRFGPAVVQCGHCTQIIQSELRDWDGMSTGRKVWVSALELLFPSFVSPDEFPMYLFTFAVALLPVLLLMLVAGVVLSPAGWGMGAAKGFVMGFLAVSLYDVLVSVRLATMVKENRAFNRTRTPPVWKR